MQRGDVYLTDVDLPIRAGGQGGRLRKYLVVLHNDGVSDFAYTEMVAVVIASSTDYINPERVREYEVAVPGGGPFPDDTLIDCRWPMTVKKARLLGARCSSLPPDLMRQVDDALIWGLGMMDPQPESALPEDDG